MVLGVSYPATRRPQSSFTENDAGPRSTGSPRAATQAPAAESESPSSFFKSPKGVAALVLAVAGISYVIYSSQNDRINSPIR